MKNAPHINSKMYNKERYYEYVRDNANHFTNKEHFRLLTFNVEGFKRYSDVMKVLRESNADIIGLNEALFFDNDLRSRFFSDVNEMGYTHHMMCNAYGINVIVSKHAIVKKSVIRLLKDPIKKRNRYAIAVHVEVDSKILKLALTHLDPFDRTDETKYMQLCEIMMHIDDSYVLMGDFNLSPRSELYTAVTRSFHDSFPLLRRERPITSWIMTQLDFIFVGDSFEHHIVDSQCHISDASDHCAVYVDVIF